jgi:hypothetical protein
MVRERRVPKHHMPQGGKAMSTGAPQPRRVQLQRRKGWRMPANTLKVDRTTPFGNPFSAKDHGHARAVALYCAWIVGRPITAAVLPDRRADLARRRAAVLHALPTLRGKHLACWCRLPEEGGSDTCHAAVLLALANGLSVRPSPVARFVRAGASKRRKGMD